MLGAQRRVEARIGQLFGEPKEGRPSAEYTQRVERFDPMQRRDFRLLGKALRVGAQRRVEARIGQLLGEVPRGHPKSEDVQIRGLCPEGVSFADWIRGLTPAETCAVFHVDPKTLATG